MRSNSLYVLSALLTAGFSGSGVAADALRGEALARQWCSACHVVAPDQHQGSDKVPTFASIARRPEFNARELEFFLLDPHPKMPNMGLTRMEAADLAAYIEQLGR